MEHVCQNCTLTITENFCSNCGQKRFKRIDKKYIMDEVQYSLIHTNKGLLYSAKKILSNPGKTAREFIYGNRVNHYKPILLVFLLSGISAFLSFKVIGLGKIMEGFYSTQHLNSDFMNDMFTFMSSYHSFIMLALIPIFALSTKLALRKWGQNYYEHVIMNAYVLSFYTMLSILLVCPVLYLLRHNVSAVMTISNCLVLLMPAILVWFYKGFYLDKPLKNVILKVLLIIALILVAYLLLIIFVTIGFIILVMINGPEMMKYFKPQ